MWTWLHRLLNPEPTHYAGGPSEADLAAEREADLLVERTALAHQLHLMRGTMREVLLVNSVIVPSDQNDSTLRRTLLETFGKPGLAEVLLMGLKRTGAVTVYRDASDEGVRVRFAVTRRDREAWPQSPTDGPATVEMDSDGITVVPRKIDPEVAATPPLPPEPVYEYSRLGMQPEDVSGNPFSAFMDPPTAPAAQAQMGSAALGLRPYGAPDPRKPHGFVARNAIAIDAATAAATPVLCTHCGLSEDEGQHAVE